MRTPATVNTEESASRRGVLPFWESLSLSFVILAANAKLRPSEDVSVEHFPPANT